MEDSVEKIQTRRFVILHLFRTFMFCEALNYLMSPRC